MKGIVMLFILALGSSASFASSSDFFSLTAKDIDGKTVNFSKFKNKVILAVNTASQCGFTYQYGGLQNIYEKYKEKGVIVLGFPSNDFGKQEPGSNQEIKQFCENKKVSFPLFAKNSVTGSEKQPVFHFLVKNSPATNQSEVAWNFEKFLVGKSGNVIARFPSSIEPESIEILSAIENELSKD